MFRHHTVKGFSRTQIILIAAVLFVIVGVIFVFVLGGKQTKNQLTGAITVWGLDSPSTMEQLTQGYQQAQPGVTVTYKQLNQLTYEQDLINALAAGRGPDVFMIHNSWLPKHYDKLWPLTESQLPITQFRGLYPTVVEQNFAPDGVVYALPMYLDTLVMLYNKDSFDAAEIAIPPKTWLELQNLIPKLRAIDKNGRLTKAAAAIGGSPKSVSRATDLLNLLMLQSGSRMVSRDFTETQFFPEGVQALDFYTQFTNAAKDYYAWDENFGYSLDSFANGSTAVIFAYSSQLPAIKDKNQFIKIGIAPMLQSSEAKQSVNWADYWGYSVSIKSRAATAGWDFISYVTNSASQKIYIAATGRPPVLRSLIAQYQNDPQLGVFAKQALTARSWPQIDNIAVANSFAKAIEAVIGGRATSDRALQQAGEEINDLMLRRRNRN